MATIAAQVSSTGILIPDYADVLQQVRIVYWTIYGSDANLDDDTQDGQFLAALAQIIDDLNQTCVDVYNSFSPATAQGVGLSSVVKINGLRRAVPTNSQVEVTLVGVVGTQILNGQVGDRLNLNTVWALPAVVEIPIEGEITVTATSTALGQVTAAEDTLSVILTPTRGWQTVNNPSAATSGLPVEQDPQLRLRQSQSTSLPALTILESIYASVASVQGVSRLAIYENDTDIADGEGLPPHSISIVASGGDVQGIATAIAVKKSPGTGTYGTTNFTVIDRNGVPNVIKFFQLSTVPLVIRITIQALPEYVSTTGDQLRQAVVDFINALIIGEDSYLTRLYSPANLGGVGLGATFVVTSILQARDGNSPAAVNIPIAFNEAATLSLSDIDLTVT